MLRSVDDPDVVRGWIDASNGTAFRVFESRPWRQGWLLHGKRERWRRFYASLAYTSASTH